jgi:prepilin-type N-terminal cleavage/methylation domain-containing protein
MSGNGIQSQWARRPGRGFTLLELLVAVGVLSLIAVVLFRIFDQTQRALRSNVAQVDVLEGGRAILELLGRELEQMASPGEATNAATFYVGLVATNRILDLPGDGPQATRLNSLEGIYFLRPNRTTGTNRLWDINYYQILAFSPTNAVIGGDSRPLTYRADLAREGVGSLARRTATLDLAWTNTGAFFDLLRRTDADSLNEFSRVVDGLVHFKVTPLDSRGVPLELEYLRRGTNPYPEVLITNRLAPFPSIETFFYGSAVPAALHLEVGILEPQAVERWRALPTPATRARFLTNQAARIHYFQQRIPVRSAPRLMPSQP